MIRISTESFVPEVVNSDLFGANILAIRDTLDGSTGYEQLFLDSNATGLRYPGGSIAEEFFDISDPDSSLAHGENGVVRDFIPISEALEFANSNEIPISIVIPTRTMLGTRVDGNGDRFPKIDEGGLRKFVHDLLTGEYGEAEISAFEIGNEYWGAGQMSTVEYGRVSSTVARIVDDELSNSGLPQEAANIDIIVQVGTNYNHASIDENYSDLDGAQEILNEVAYDYNIELDREEVLFSSGTINWTRVNNLILMNEFTNDLETDAVDAISVHVYSKESKLPGTRDFALNEINETWAEKIPDVETHVTEWNQSRSPGLMDEESDFGLFQAQEMLDIVESFVTSGVDSAQVWPLLQNTQNALAKGFTYDELTPSGQMFAWMADSIPETVILDFAPDDPNVTEEVTSDASVHAFYGDGKMTMFIASKSDETVHNVIDVTQLFTDASEITAEVLSVKDGSRPGAHDAEAEVDNVDGSEVYVDGFIEAHLAPGEIMRVQIGDFTPTSNFESIIGDADEFIDTGDIEVEVATDDDPIASLFDQSIVPEAEKAIEDLSVDDSGDSNISFAIVLGLGLLAGLAGLG